MSWCNEFSHKVRFFSLYDNTFSVEVYTSSLIYYLIFIWQQVKTWETIFSPLQPPVTLLWRHNGCDGVSNHQPHDCLLNRSFRPRSKKTFHSPVIGEFPAQRASNAANVSIWWRRHVNGTVSLAELAVSNFIDFLYASYIRGFMAFANFQSNSFDAWIGVHFQFISQNQNFDQIVYVIWYV